MTYWSAAGLLKTFRTPRGLESTFTYDAEGRLVQDANNAAFAWNLALTEEAGIAGPRQITLTSAEGRASRYDVYVPAAGSVERTVTDALGVQTIYAEAPTGRHLTSPAGTLQSATTHDPRFGAQAPYASSVSLSTPGGTQWARTVAQTVTLADPVDPFSVQTLVAEATTNGNRSTMVYDGSTRTTTVTTPKGRKAAVAIDSTGRMTSEQLGNRTPVQYTYDARGRLAQVTQGARTTTLTYNPGGFVDTLTDPLGRTTAFEYDAAGRATRQTLPDGRGIGFVYDADGNLTGLTPPGRTRHHLTRWLQGDLRAYRPPVLDEGQPVQTTYTYNSDRQLTRVHRPDGHTIRFTYGATTGSLNTITTPQGPRTVLWNGTNGLVSSVTTPGQFTINRGYDGGLLTAENAGSPFANGPFSSTVNWTYNADLQVSSQTVTDAGGTPSQVALTYDHDGWLTAAGALALTWNRNRWTLASTTLGAVTHRFTSNAFGELTDAQVTHLSMGLYTLELTRDKLGRIKTKAETLGGVTTTSDYSYDNRGRLKTVMTNGTLAARYTYDANSNRTARTVDGVTVTATYDAQDRLLTQGNLTFTYTLNGDLLTKTDSVTGQTTTYTYDVFGNLTRVDLPNGDRLEYVIDGFNRRVAQYVNGAQVRQYVYQSPLQIAAELDATGQLVSRFVYGSHAHVPDYLVKNGTTYRLITDHLGSVRLVVDAQTGTIAQRLDYDEFGRVLQDTNPGFQPFGFAGGLYDPATQLVRFGARDYDPETGRWTSKDPILFVGGDTNLYSYVLQNSINFVDPEGTITSDPGEIGACLGIGGNYSKLIEHDEDVIQYNERQIEELESEIGRRKNKSCEDPSSIDERRLRILRETTKGLRDVIQRIRKLCGPLLWNPSRVNRQQPTPTPTPTPTPAPTQIPITLH
jgi:RHS repeat-associated protein